jgi:YD repeat-containing protein
MNNPLLYTDPGGRFYELFGFVGDAAEQRLFAALNTKTGLTVTNNNGKLDYARDANGNPIVATDANGKPLGSATARGDLIKGIDSADRMIVQRTDNSATVDMGIRMGSLIRLDLADISKIQPGNNGLATFDASMIFLHEAVGHAFLDLEDPTSLQLQQKPSMWGATVAWENRIRTELGLPLRNQYRAEAMPNGKRYIPFAEGRVWLP